METERRTQGPPDVVHRDFTLRLARGAGEESRAFGAEDLIPIALSSEQPVERYDWWDGERYLEVLDHSPAAVDLAYAKDGLPFLLNHDTREQIGLMENVRVDSDRILRGEVRFSKSQRAQEVRQDIIDGIRKKVSVGYRLDHNNVQKSQAEGDKLPTWRYLRWMPMEGSSVPIPADYTVGVGRAAGGAAPTGQNPPAPAARAAEETTVEKTETTAPAGADTRGVAVGADRAEQERTRGLAALAKAHGRSADLGDWITTGKTVDQAKDELLAAARSSTTPIDGTGAADVRLTEREEREYSVVRGIQGLLRGQRSGFEFEVHSEVARQLGRDTQGFFVPTSIRAQNPAMAPDARLQERTQLSVGGAGKGAEAKFTEYGGFIDLLRNRSALLQLGAQMLPGLQGDVAFVGQSGAGVVGWNAEAVNQALSSLTLALRSMAPKGLQSATTYTRQLLLQSVFSVENLVRNDIGKLHALAIDAAGISGTGTGNQPRGILNTSGIGAVVGGTNGAQPTYDHIVDLESEVAVDNADVSTCGYLAHTRMRGRLKKTPELGNTAALPVWRDGEMNGYGAFASNQVPSNQTKGTSTDCSPIIFGAFGEMLIGEWGAMEILVDPLTLGPSVIKVMSIQFVDIFLRYVEAFAAMADARP